jgi:glutamine amidotransferase
VKIGIVDYGMGNIGSVRAALEYLRADCFVSSDPDALRTADAFILPGVGAFGVAMENLVRLGLPVFLDEQVRRRGKYLLGICLGMQLLAEDSTEEGFHRGLGWIDGHVVALEPSPSMPVPHVGWSAVRRREDDPLMAGLDANAHFYFDHSYHLVCDPAVVTSTCEFERPVVASVRRGTVFATQFHPEKSQRSGLKLLRNFLNVAEKGAS